MIVRKCHFLNRIVRQDLYDEVTFEQRTLLIFHKSQNTSLSPPWSDLSLIIFLMQF